MTLHAEAAIKEAEAAGREVKDADDTSPRKRAKLSTVDGVHAMIPVAAAATTVVKEDEYAQWEKAMLDELADK